MNPVMLRKHLEKKLMRRGMLKTTTGNVIKPPNRIYNNLGEEILWLLNESDIKLSVNDISKYLDADKKTINKVMRKLTATNVNLVTKKKQGPVFVYSANFTKDLDIPTAYKLVRMEATKRIR